MTLDTEQIRKDREAGTPGPWHVGRYALQDIDRGWFVGGNGYCRAQIVGPATHIEANARRIARVPELEAAVLAANEHLVKRLESLQKYFDLCDDELWIILISEALAAFKEATK